MCSRFYESIISQVSADVGLDDFSADPVSWNKVFIVALRALISSSSHGVQRRLRNREIEKPTAIIEISLMFWRRSIIQEVSFDGF